MEEERRRRRENRAIFLLEKQSNYEQKRLHYEGLMRARQSLAESRLQHFKEEKVKLFHLTSFPKILNTAVPYYLFKDS